MKTLSRGLLALSFIAISIVAIPGKASAQSLCNTGCGFPMSTTTLTSPVVIDSTLTSPVVIDRTVTSPVVIDSTLTQPAVVVPSTYSPIMPTYIDDRRHLLNLDLPFVNFSLF